MSTESCNDLDFMDDALLVEMLESSSCFDDEVADDGRLGGVIRSLEAEILGRPVASSSDDLMVTDDGKSTTWPDDGGRLVQEDIVLWAPDDCESSVGWNMEDPLFDCTEEMDAVCDLGWCYAPPAVGGVQGECAVFNCGEEICALADQVFDRLWQ